MRPVYRPPLLVIAVVLATAGASHAQTTVQVCVGSDKVLRYATGACPSGQTAVSLTQASSGPAQDQGRAAADLQSRVSSLEAKVADLRAQVAELEKDANAPGPAKQVPRPVNKVTAPFEVVDDAGKTIFAVVTNRRGFEVRSASGKVVVQAFSEDAKSGVKVFDPGVPTSFAAIGSMNGTPVVQTTWNGKPRTSIGVKGEGAASLDLYGDNGLQIVELTKGASGGGRLSLFDVEGAAQVQAGIAAEGPAVVRVGKSPSCLPKGGLIVPDCIQSGKLSQ